jgi:ribosomal-protein-alanine N-acetyltransferase
VSQFTIRDYSADDFEQLWILDQICFTQGIAYSKRELRYFLSAEGSLKIVAHSDSNPPSIVGFLIAEMNKAGTAHIITIDVHPDARRAGLGTQLMQIAEQRLKAQKCKVVLLEVAVDNTAAITFYKRHGFTVLKALPRYYNNSIDGLLLGKKLNGS